MYKNGCLGRFGSLQPESVPLSVRVMAPQKSARHSWRSRNGAVPSARKAREDQALNRAMFGWHGSMDGKLKPISKASCVPSERYS